VCRNIGAGWYLLTSRRASTHGQFRIGLLRFTLDTEGLVIDDERVAGPPARNLARPQLEDGRPGMDAGLAARPAFAQGGAVQIAFVRLLDLGMGDQVVEEVGAAPQARATAALTAS
jgi:hypothetical protein